MTSARYRITRAPTAAPRRAGQQWPIGVSVAELTAEQAAVVARDPGYAIAREGSIDTPKSANLVLLDAPPPRRAKQRPRG